MGLSAGQHFPWIPEPVKYFYDLPETAVDRVAERKAFLTFFPEDLTRGNGEYKRQQTVK